MIKVLAIGVFDLFHRGHLEFLTKARSLGDTLTVAVNTDRKVAAYKRTPIVPLEDRLEIVRGLRCVDAVDISDEFSALPLIERHLPNVLVHGDDWTRERYLVQIGLDEQALTDLGVELRFVPHYPLTTTSRIIERLPKRGSR